MKHNTVWMRFVATSLAAVMCIGTLGGKTLKVSAEEIKTSSSVNISSDRLSENYSHMSQGYKAKAYAGETRTTEVSKNIIESVDADVTSDSYGYDGDAVAVKHKSRVKVLVDVPETALYNIGFDYLSNDTSILPIEFSLKIDNEIPFYELRSLSFETTWESDGEKSFDRYGNETVTLPVKKVKWEHKAATDGAYRYSKPFEIELTKGSHEFEIEVNEGSFLLGNITLEAPTIVKKHEPGITAEGNALITIEAEDFYERNNSSIHAIGEFDSSLSPITSTSTVLNILDGDSFKEAGQAVTYKFNVEKEGYYYIALNYKQSEKNDFPVFIDYRIDGVLLDDAFENYPMEYTTKYAKATLKDDAGTNLSVYLKPGEHTVSLTITEDNLRYVLEKVDEIMSGINDLSLEVTKVAGTNKDKYRDLKLTRYIPDVQSRLDGWVASLYELAGMATKYVDAKDPKDVAAFGYLLIAADQLASLAKDPNELIYRVEELATSVNSINTQIANFIDIINKNNISIDRIYFYQEGAKLPGKQNVFATLGASVKRFFYSFTGQAYSASNVNEDHIQVWVNRPRQYVEIMQKMVDEEFTPKTGIEVDLCLMTDAQKLVLANASGDTPDVCTGINYSIPFELGIRGALVDLTRFNDYKEVFSRYSEGLLLAGVIGDGIISLPETMNYYLLFYRTDTLGKLGLEAPDTLDELVAMLPDLQMRGLNVFYPTAPMLGMRNFHGTTPIIFQMNGKLYGKTAIDLELGSETTIEGFTKLTELFTIYDMPVDIPNFYQHFRNGDIPVGIADFNSYNLILNAAPEIANSWDIALVPGIEDSETGKINRYMSGGAESTVMFKSSDEREEKAWEFMKWWSDATTQAKFGQMLQIMYGKEYIWPTANLEAFEQLPFPTAHKNTIITQAEQIVEAPRLLGSYMLEREMSNAFNDIVVNSETLRSRVDAAVKTVNRETERKLEEFGYIDSEGNVIKEYVVPSVDVVHKILTR